MGEALFADGWSNRDIGEAVGMHYNQVAIWRRRYQEMGLPALADEDRSRARFSDLSTLTPPRIGVCGTRAPGVRSGPQAGRRAS